MLLGFMILGQVGFVSYHPSLSQKSLGESVERQVTHSGSAKAFGLVSPKGKHFQVENVTELKQVFKTHGYNLIKAKNEGTVPRLYLSKLPKDMRKKSRRAPKTAFIQVVLPYVLKINEEILNDRERLLALQEREKQGGHLRHSEKMWLSKLATEYRSKSAKIETLLYHVDVIPPSLALAQGILESGWGTSPAAVHKNSTFGHMRTKKDVARFASLEGNVRAYILNLNRHAAYTPFRQERALLRKNNAKLSGHLLATGLKKYSVRGEAYIRDLQKLIRYHELDGYDHITLDQQHLQEL